MFASFVAKLAKVSQPKTSSAGKNTDAEVVHNEELHEEAIPEPPVIGGKSVPQAADKPKVGKDGD